MIAWPQAPTHEQARAFAVAWCLLPAARVVLGRHPEVGALVLAAARRSGRVVASLVEVGPWVPGDRLPPEAEPSPRAHAHLAKLLGEDPLRDLGPCEGAFLPACQQDGRWATIAVATRGDDGVHVTTRAPAASPELDLEPGRPDESEGAAREIALRHLALRRLARLERSVGEIGAARSTEERMAARERARAALQDRHPLQHWWAAAGPTEWLSAPTSRELRERVMERRFRPWAERILRWEAGAESVLYCIAQYWCDEAIDAVHEKVVPCPVTNPAPWPDCLRDNPFVTVEEDCFGLLHWSSLLVEHALGLPGVDDNGGMVAAFASCVGETGDQDMDLREAYRPYAIARRRPGGGVDVEIVGRVLRPEWEDAMTPEARESLPPRPVTPPAPRPWLERLLGRLLGS